MPVMLAFKMTLIFLYERRPLVFITCYRRLYIDIPPFLVISPNLAKNYLVVCDLDIKNGVLHVALTFETTLIFFL